jgi:hypothetical protein
MGLNSLTTVGIPKSRGQISFNSILIWENYVENAQFEVAFIEAHIRLY